MQISSKALGYRGEEISLLTLTTIQGKCFLTCAYALIDGNVAVWQYQWMACQGTA